MAQKQFNVWHIATFQTPCALNNDGDRTGKQRAPVTALAMPHLKVLKCTGAPKVFSRNKNSGYFCRTMLVRPVFKVM